MSQVTHYGDLLTIYAHPYNFKSDNSISNLVPFPTLLTIDGPGELSVWKVLAIIRVILYWINQLNLFLLNPSLEHPESFLSSVDYPFNPCIALNYRLLHSLPPFVHCRSYDTNSRLSLSLSSQLVMQELTANRVEHKVYQSDSLDRLTEGWELKVNYDTLNDLSSLKIYLRQQLDSHDSNHDMWAQFGIPPC